MYFVLENNEVPCFIFTMLPNYFLNGDQFEVTYLTTNLYRNKIHVDMFMIFLSTLQFHTYNFNNLLWNNNNGQYQIVALALYRRVIKKVNGSGA